VESFSSVTEAHPENTSACDVLNIRSADLITPIRSVSRSSPVTGAERAVDSVSVAKEVRKLTYRFWGSEPFRETICNANAEPFVTP
jgi:hypothetical protein